jgi:hypothetical protein
MDMRQGAWRRAASLLAAVMLALGLTVAVNVATAAPAHALCASHPIIGNWYNLAASPSMSRVEITLFCDDVRYCDQFGNCSGGTDTHFRIRAWGRCHPIDCDWGTQRLTRMGPNTTSWHRAIYEFGFKTSYVWVNTAEWLGVTWLNVVVANDFTPADGRQDYTTDEWMLK